MKTIRLIMILCCLTWLASCNSDDGITDTSPVAVQFGSGNIAVPKTTTGGDQWTQGDKIGIFMIANGAASIVGNIKENADNIAYKADAGSSNQSSFSPVGGTPIYYPVDGSKVDFIAYYPYKSPLTNYTYPVDVSDQSDASKIDLLYSNNAKAKDKNSSTVDLQFYHKLSKLSFTLTSGAGSPDLTGAKIEISGVAATAAIELKDGSLTPTNSNRTITANTAANGLSSSAIMVPQTLSGTKLIVTLADNVSKYEWPFTTAEWKTGKKHEYTITVDKTGITVTTGNITDWTGKDDNPTEGGAGIWKVGDYYPDPNVDLNDPTEKAKIQGIVFWVDPADSRHGKVVGLNAGTGKRWDDGYYTGANNTVNGRANMQKIAAYISSQGKNWSNFPAFEWVHNLNGAGQTYTDANATGVWYLPSISELQYLYCAWNGKAPETWYFSGSNNPGSSYPGFTADNSARANFNSKIQDVGGTILGTGWYWSSSETSDSNVFEVNFYGGNTFSGFKAGIDGVRCVLAF